MAAAWVVGVLVAINRNRQLLSQVNRTLLSLAQAAQLGLGQAVQLEQSVRCLLLIRQVRPVEVEVEELM